MLYCSGEHYRAIMALLFDITPDKGGYQVNIFLIFFAKNYVVGTH